MGIEVTGILGLILLALTIYAIIKIVNSGAGTGRKVIWTLVVLLLGPIGWIIWFFAGPKG